MKKINFLFVLMLLLAACGPASTGSGESVTGCRATLDGISAQYSGHPFPDYFQTEDPVKQGGEFDVMQYFVALDHLSMQPGYVLDYVYHFDGMGGYPVLYVRPADQPAYPSEADLRTSGYDLNYMDYVQADDTPESYFQFVVLATTGDLFYMFWHADYAEKQLVCNKTDINNIVASLDGNFGYRMPLVSRVRAAMLQGVIPSVSVGEQTVEVRLVTFTRWGGFYLETYTINRSSPHTIQDVQEKILIPYECGVMF
jgi:hypothetical protein